MGIKLKIKKTFLSAERISSQIIQRLDIVRSLPLKYQVNHIMYFNSGYTKSMQLELNTEQSIEELKEIVSDLSIQIEQGDKSKIDERDKLYSNIKDLELEKNIYIKQKESFLDRDKEYLFLQQEYINYIYDNYRDIINEVYDVPNEFDYNLNEDEMFGYINFFYESRNESMEKLNDSEAEV